MPSPHDALFREVLGVPVNAASELRAVLPPELADRLDLDRMERCPGSFVDEELRWRHTDLLFTAPLGGQDAFVYVLVEHQSSTHPMMAFRMLRYLVRIWDRYLKDNPGSTKLPAVIPIVVHHNKRQWNAPTDLYDLFDLDDGTAQAAVEYLPRFRFLLDDLNRLDEQMLRARPLTPPALISLELLTTMTVSPRLIDELYRLSDDFKQVADGPDGKQYLITFLTYIKAVGNVPADELYDLFASFGPEGRKAYMTTADQLRTEGEAKLLVRLLTRKFGPLSPAVLDVVNTASAEQIDTWTDRILTADTLDDVLR